RGQPRAAAPAPGVGAVRRGGRRARPPQRAARPGSLRPRGLQHGHGREPPRDDMTHGEEVVGGRMSPSMDATTPAVDAPVAEPDLAAEDPAEEARRSRLEGQLRTGIDALVVTACVLFTFVALHPS